MSDHVESLTWLTDPHWEFCSHHTRHLLHHSISQAPAGFGWVAEQWNKVDFHRPVTIALGEVLPLVRHTNALKCHVRYWAMDSYDVLTPRAGPIFKPETRP